MRVIRRGWHFGGMVNFCCLLVLGGVVAGCGSVDPVPPPLHVSSIASPVTWSADVVVAPKVAVREPAAAPLPGKQDSARWVVPKGGGYKKVGKPYTIRGVRYVPRHQPDYAETGIASWYGGDFHGKMTANGEIYDMGALTAAHRTLPLPSLVSVTHVGTGKSVIVRVNDRGPFRKGRIIDVSARVAEALGFLDHGVAEVRVQYLSPAPLNGDDSREKAHLASLSR